jgi:predicted O-methyltransferase YrrM
MKKQIENIIPTIAEIEEYVFQAGSDHVHTFGGKFEGGIQAQQIPDEIAPALHSILSSGQPIKAYLEIGACAGGTTFLIHRFLNPGKIVLIDDNKHPKHHIRPYILGGITRAEIIGNSHAQGTVDALMTLDLRFDAILIDGDHSYYGCKLDAEIYMNFLAPGGFLIFHDSLLPEWGVKAVVEELKDDLEIDFFGEFVSQKHHRPLGIAIFRKGATDEDQQ